MRYLILNAGVVLAQRTLTTDGFEVSFALNYLSRFLLLQRLMPLLRSSAAGGRSARVVVIGGALANGAVSWRDPSLLQRYDLVRAVSQFCAANDIFVYEQARQLTRSGASDVSITSLKLGVVKTRIRENFQPWMRWIVERLFDPLIGQSPAAVAASADRLLLDAEFEGVSGVLFSHIRKFQRTAINTRLASSREGERLWALSERLAALALEGKRHGSTGAPENAKR